jgi:hypothetical protein
VDGAAEAEALLARGGPLALPAASRQPQDPLDVEPVAAALVGGEGRVGERADRGGGSGARGAGAEAARTSSAARSVLGSLRRSSISPGGKVASSPGRGSGGSIRTRVRSAASARPSDPRRRAITEVPGSGTSGIRAGATPLRINRRRARVAAT